MATDKIFSYFLIIIFLFPQIIGIFTIYENNIFYNFVCLISLLSAIIFIKYKNKFNKYLKFGIILLFLISTIPTYYANFFQTLDFFDNLNSTKKINVKTKENKEFLLVQHKENTWLETYPYCVKKLYEINGSRKNLILEKRDRKFYDSLSFEYVEIKNNNISFYIINDDLVIYSIDYRGFHYMPYNANDIKNKDSKIKQDLLLKALNKYDRNY